MVKFEYKNILTIDFGCLVNIEVRRNIDLITPQARSNFQRSAARLTLQWS